MWAANSGHKLVVSALINAGADATKQKPDGKRAIDIALAKGHKEVRSFLLNFEYDNFTTTFNG